MTPNSDKAAQIALILKDLQLPAGITVRVWLPSDFPAIQTLSIVEGWLSVQIRPAEALRAWENSWPVLVVTSNNTVVGFLRAISDGEISTYISEILVEPTYQGKGLGKLLLEVCHRLVPRTRFDLLSLEKSASFYQKKGFREFRGFRKSVFTV